jgi:Fe-S cluster assembly iron-binding protein IscA
MLMVTDDAKRHLKRLLAKNTSDPNLGIRLKVGIGVKLGVLLDRKAENDYVVEHQGAKVLMVGPELFSLVEDAILDTEHNSPIASLVLIKGRQRHGEKYWDNLCVVR